MLKQIGKYTISERIGRGTYSRVYRAVDSQGRPVAIKVSTTQTEPEHLDEFQKDLVAAASVLHPNLVAVHDLGFEDEFPYLVMELVDGQDLDHLLKSNTAPSLADRIRVMQQVGEALKAAHERGIFHLDIRPSKIMLRNDGEAKLLDLGLGRLSYDPARVTEHGYLVGAPFYMSPERLTAIDTANERCDIWSFGVTFYEWIAGHHPFYDDDGDRMIGNIMDAVPADLQDVPPQLNHAIMRAIEKDPSDRYHTFAELLADLQPLIGDLKREESDALMAEALKQTDSGRWHEARRIARQLRDMDSPQDPGAQIFGISEQELEKERSTAAASVPTPQPLVAAAATMAAVTAAKAAASTAVDTPEPAPPPPVVRSQPPPPPTQAAPRAPQRPERTAPRIPPMGVKNGTTAASENGSPASARMQPAPPPSNGARAAAASASMSAAAPAVVREIDTAPRTEPPRVESTRPEPARTRTVSSQRSVAPQLPLTPPPPQQTVRILGLEEPSGFPWGKIIGFSVPALLMMGALFFFLRPVGKIAHSSTNDDAKETSTSSRVIRTDQGDPDSTPQTASASPTTPPTTGTPAEGTPGTATDPQAPIAPRIFDAKSLPTATKVLIPARRRGNSPLAGVAAPALPGAADGTELSGLPVAMNAPPPPAPVAPPQAPAPVKVNTPAPTPTSVQSVEAAREAASHIGGVFSQPELARKVSPVYPPAAVQRKKEGKVRFQATIAKDGSVKNIQLLSGDPLLNVSARQAVTQWKYRPAMLNGDPIEVTQTIVIEFNLSNR